MNKLRVPNYQNPHRGITAQQVKMYSGKLTGNKRQSGVKLILIASIRRALISWTPGSDRILLGKDKCVKQQRR